MLSIAECSAIGVLVTSGIENVQIPMARAAPSLSQQLLPRGRNGLVQPVKEALNQDLPGELGGLLVLKVDDHNG